MTESLREQKTIVEGAGDAHGQRTACKAFVSRTASAHLVHVRACLPQLHGRACASRRLELLSLPPLAAVKEGRGDLQDVGGGAVVVDERE